MGIMKNAKNIPLSHRAGNVPDVSSALYNLFQPMNFDTVTKVVKVGKVQETKTVVAFRGVIQSLSNRALLLKPEGQRSWTWLMLLAETQVPLQTDDVLDWLGVQTRVMARRNNSLYGFFYYELVQDWTGAGPT